MSLFLFAVLAFVALAGGIGVIASRKPVYSALSLLVNFAAFAVMYIMLGGQFVGVTQIIVYAGGIIVLFLFVVMLIGSQLLPPRQKGGWRRALAVVLAAVFLITVVLGLASVAPAMSPAQGAPDSGSVQAIGEALYTQYIAPVELASVLLLAGMLGGVVLARKYRSLSEE